MEKRTFIEIRKQLLNSLRPGQQTINQLAGNAGVNWKTTQRHLIVLIGKGLVREVFSSPHVKIYELTEKGKALVGEEERERER